MNDDNKYFAINVALMYLKIPEVISTLVIIIGIIGTILWSWPIYIAIGTIVTRLILFIVRLALISKKRDIERESMSFMASGEK